MFEMLSTHGVVAAALIAPPGPELIAALSAIDLAVLDDSAAVDLLISWDRQAHRARHTNHPYRGARTADSGGRT